MDETPKQTGTMLGFALEALKYTASTSTSGADTVKFGILIFTGADVTEHPAGLVAVTVTLFCPPLVKLKVGFGVDIPVLLLAGVVDQT